MPGPVWCPEKSVTLEDINVDTVVLPLFDVCIGPKESVELPIVPQRVGIVHTQLLADLDVSWPACNATKVIDTYIVCVETRQGASDVAPCTNVGSALKTSFPGSLEGLGTGTTVLSRVQCVTVDGAASQVVSLPFVVVCRRGANDSAVLLR
jgi:hypothetical protein